MIKWKPIQGKDLPSDLTDEGDYKESGQYLGYFQNESGEFWIESVKYCIYTADEEDSPYWAYACDGEFIERCLTHYAEIPNVPQNQFKQPKTK